MTALPRSMTASAAGRLLADLEIQRPEEIDVELIAAHHGVSVLFRPLAHEEGHLLRVGGIGLIVVAEHARVTDKWRFVVAHELGHFVRHPQLDQLRLCTDADLHDWYKTSGHETEANDFAAELLMPAALFAPLCDCNRPSLHDIAAIATRFRTSLTATAIRFVELCAEPCAVVYSTNGVVSWARRNAEFPLFIPRGLRLGAATYAGDLHAGKAVDDRAQLIDGAGWSDGTYDGEREVEVQEHSRRLGPYGVLTLLWHNWK